MIETGTATDVFDLLNKVGIFAGNIGWTVNKSTATELHLQSGADYWAFGADNNLDAIDDGVLNFVGSNQWDGPGIVVYGARGFDTNQAYDSQPGSSSQPAVMGIFSQTDIKEYRFLTNATADYIHILARRDAANWAVLLIGQLQKFGTYTGGAYLSGMPLRRDPSTTRDVYLFDSNDDGTAVNADIDGQTDLWHQSGSAPSGTRLLRCLKNWFESSAVDQVDAANWSSRGAMFPLMAFLNRDPGFSYGGHVPDVRHLQSGSLSEGAEFTLGADNWIFISDYAFRLIP